MSETRDPIEPAAHPNEGPADAPTYQGSRFPWWLTLVYLAFILWAVSYVGLFVFPDLRAWLSR